MDLDTTLDRFSNHVKEIDQVLQFAIQGISKSVHGVGLMKALKDYKLHGKEDSVPLQQKYGRMIDSAERDAEFASTQIESGFPILYAQALVAIWSALETLVVDLVAVFLREKPDFMKSDNIKKIRISISEYELLSKDERYRYIAKELSRKMNADLRPGIKRYELLLEAVNLNGKVSENVRKRFFEFWALRNNIAHRFGVVDRRLSESCPWLGYKVGDKLVVKPEQYKYLLSAVMEYFVEILTRDLVRQGQSREEAEDKMSKVVEEPKPENEGS